MRYYLLFDNNGNDKLFIQEKIGIPITVIYSPFHKRKILSWIHGSLNVISKSKQNDTIICWYDFQAVLCWWICHLLFKRRNIVCINILLKDKSSKKNKIVSYLYKKSLLSTNFKASVTSTKYGQWLNKKLRINVEYTLIHDVYHDFYEFGQSVEQIPNSVFCGGNNGRDWDFIIKVAQKLPDIRFNIVMPHDVYIKYHSAFTKNMNVRYDIPYHEFMKELCSSSIVCLPLDTQAPAGLIVMFQAAANLKPIITTKTATTIEYITENRGVAISNELELWINSIISSFTNLNKSKEKAKNLKNYLQYNCSETLFINNLKEMIL